MTTAELTDLLAASRKRLRLTGLAFVLSLAGMVGGMALCLIRPPDELAGQVVGAAALGFSAVVGQALLYRLARISGREARRVRW